MARIEGLHPNTNAFLDMLADSEGTPQVKGSDDGYNVIVGGKLFIGYHDHPRILVPLPKLGIKSSAAGRYQLLARYFDSYKASLHLSDFGPEAQDAIAIQQIKESRATDNILLGKIEPAISQCAHIWASLPGAGYGQRENFINTLLAAYAAAGGALG